MISQLCVYFWIKKKNWYGFYYSLSISSVLQSYKYKNNGLNSVVKVKKCFENE